MLINKLKNKENDNGTVLTWSMELINNEVRIISEGKNSNKQIVFVITPNGTLKRAKISLKTDVYKALKLDSNNFILDDDSNIILDDEIFYLRVLE